MVSRELMEGRQDAPLNCRLRSKCELHASAYKLHLITHTVEVKRTLIT